MTLVMNKVEARAAVDLAIEDEGENPHHLHRRHEWLASKVAVTDAALDAFAAACEEETRAGIAAWIADAPARIAAQSAAGAVPLHYMHTIGQLAAAADLAEAIRNKVDQKEGR
jgi:hypothetical protein